MSRRHALLAVLHVLGQLLILFSAAYVLPVATSLFYADGTAYQFMQAALLTFAAGMFTVLATRRYKRELKSRDGFLLVTTAWVALSALGTLPLMLTIPELKFTDAFFEATSGLTTTGSTILTGLDAMPPAVNIWRLELHWIGGLGIIVFAIAILPLLGVGGMQIYRAESTGPIKDTKLTPRIAQTAKALWLTYAGMTAICTISLVLCGMSVFDAICHGFSVISLGGFSTHDASVGFFDSAVIEAVIIGFMLLSSMNFARHFLAFRRWSLRPYLGQPEVRAMLILLGGGILLVSIIVHRGGTYPDLLTSLRHTAFNLISIASTAGFVTQNYERWPDFVGFLFLLLSGLVCNVGSTGGGIKMFRTLLLQRQTFREMRMALHPQAIEPLRIGAHIIPNRIAYAVLAFIVVYFMTAAILTFIMLLSGLDIVSSVSAVIASINNMGPGLGRIGPSTTYQSLTDFQTWVCSVAMLLGRLEIFSVLVLFTPAFWRK